VLGLVAMVASLALNPAQAQETVFTLTIKDHQFDPPRLDVPANVKFKLVVKNLDNERAEFESKPMKIEKIIAANAETTLNVGPLKPGEYPFVEEFHEDVARGAIVAR
jgi:hypothetical protein